MTDFTRYQRQLQLPGFGPLAQQKLQQSSVLVIGAGGLGVPVLQYLTGMGVGRIGIVDGDTISLTNLHRQVLYTQQEIGLQKAVIAKEKLQALNADVQCDVYAEMLTVANALNIIKQYDVVVDASDNFTTRYLINDACVITGKPFVYGAVQQFEGHVSVFNYNGGPTYRCLYPQQPAADEIPDCNGAGILGVVPGIIGCCQALEVVKIIVGIGKTLSGQVKIFDFLNEDDYKIKLKINPANKSIKTLQQHYNADTNTGFTPVTPLELNQWYGLKKTFAVIDVRQPAEYANGHLQHAVTIPLASFMAHEHPFIPDIPLVFICQKGGRSSRAAAWLAAQNKNLEIYNLTGGLDAWTQHLGNTLITY